MFSNDRKRARGDGVAREKDGGGVDVVPATAAAPSGPLRLRAVNTAQSCHNDEGAQGKHRQPLIKTNGARTGSAVAYDSHASSGAASERSSTSQSHAAPPARGRPHRPVSSGQALDALPSSSTAVAVSRDDTTPAVKSVYQYGMTYSRRNGLLVKQKQCSNTGASVVSVAASSASNPATDELHATWRAKRERLESEVHLLEEQLTQLTEEAHAVEDAIEGMLTEFEEDKRLVEVRHANTVARYQGLMKSLHAREDLCLAAKQRAIDSIEVSIKAVSKLCAQQERTQEAIILATDQRETLEKQLSGLQTKEAERVAFLHQLQGEEERMKDATYGLSGEVRELVMGMERLKSEKKRIEISAMETEIARRELYSLCEELKGSIRVYCRVKGSTNVDLQTVAAVANNNATAETSASSIITESALKADSDNADTAVTAPPSPTKIGRGGSVESSVSACMRSTAAVGMTAGAACRSSPAGGGFRRARSTTRSSVTASTMDAEEAGVAFDKEGERDSERRLFSYPDRTGTRELNVTEEEEPQATTSFLSSQEPQPASSIPSPDASLSRAVLETAGDTTYTQAGLPYRSGRSITIHQTRSNATSTGVSNTEETFTYDRVFPGSTHQGDVYREVEPLVRSAVDGYRVCVFAYGQTGSGKTFTMEGDLCHTPAAYGVTPRALQTILQRQDELANEGWSYELSCTFIEIYNDVIRDLFQCGSARYEAVLQQSGNPAAYHTIKHSGDRTQITNVSEKRIRNMEEFFSLYKQAVDQRSTARTDLNDKSSRSHCIFTLYITGINSTIRQRSEGVLCLVDLAGSERVNESGAQGKQFKEAVNINRSLLDLGKCIRALRSGAVVPWRNCKLTYLLQNYLGAKGAKMLMIVTVSNLRQHASESMNSLRFAAHVQETFVGTSVRRVVNMM